MKRILAIVGTLAVISIAAQAQVLLSGGLTYSQNFDTLVTSSTTATPSWADNTTLLGWYARRAATTSTGPYGSFTYASLRLDNGANNNNGWVFDYGAFSSTDRALGSIGSGTIKSNAFGVEIRNDRALPVTLDSIAYNGEQWRLGAGNVSSTNYLWFSYQVSSSALTDPFSTPSGWTPFNALTFTNRVFATATSDPAAGLDGNANAVAISSTMTGITLQPGDEVFLRWVDPDETGNDMGMAVDNVAVTFSEVPEPSTAVLGGLALFGLIAWRRMRR
jgi:hypothetical protein